MIQKGFPFFVETKPKKKDEEGEGGQEEAENPWEYLPVVWCSWGRIQERALSRSRPSRALARQPEHTEGSESRERRSYGVALTLAERRPTGSRGRRKPAAAAGSRSPSDDSDQTRQRTEDHGRVLFIYEEDDEETEEEEEPSR
jgi:hypothetical protein